jgi:hypothetical protein
VTVGVNGNPTIDLISIPSNYKHLQIRGIIKATTGSQLNFNINNDVGSNYSQHGFMGTGSVINNWTVASASLFRVFPFNGLPTATSTFGNVIIDILDYSNTNKYKTIRIFYGQDSNGSGETGLGSGTWLSNSVVSIVNVSLPTGSFAQNSKLALYGIRG